jgi:serine/threonine protein kinase
MTQKAHCDTFGNALADRDFILAFAPTACAQDGRYHSLNPIDGKGGNGNFSVVFEARDSTSGASVALKFFVESGNTYRKLGFERECRLLHTTFRNEELFVQTIAGAEELKVAVTPAGMPNSGLNLNVTLPYIALEWMKNGTVEGFCGAPPTDIFAVKRRLRAFRAMCRCVMPDLLSANGPEIQGDSWA